MNTPMNASGWSRGRWVLIISTIFLAQVFLVFMERAPKNSSPPKSDSKYYLRPQPITSRQIAGTFFASDPTLFSGVSLHSFSGPAWLRIPASDYRFPESTKPTKWLALEVNQLGCLPELRSSAKSVELAPEELAGPAVRFFFPEPEPTVQTQSVVRLEGELASRVVDMPATWPPWSGNDKDVLNRTEVQLAVDRAGVVVSTLVLQDGRSGSKEADLEALEIARMLRFSPSINAAGITRGKLVIEWRTALPVENEVPAKNM